MFLVFRRQISFPHSNDVIFKSKVKYKSGRQNVFFNIKTACISETVSDTAKVTIQCKSKKEFLVQILQTYYRFLSTLDYKFLFDYLQL